jgi:hypothetical protein
MVAVITPAVVDDVAGHINNQGNVYTTLDEVFI